MFRPGLAISVILLPLTIQLSAANAQSWKDWADQNPAYQPSAPTTSKPLSPAPQRLPAPSPAPRAVAPNPTRSASPEGLSTRHPIFEQQFLAGCMQSPRFQQYCQCTLKEIQNNYTIQEFTTIVEFMDKNNEIPSEIYDVAFKCIS